MRILVATAVILGITSLPALPQGEYGRNKKLDEQYEQQQIEMKRQEKEYNESLKRLRVKQDTKTPNDPWRNVRPAESNRR